VNRCRLLCPMTTARTTNISRFDYSDAVVVVVVVVVVVIVDC